MAKFGFTFKFSNKVNTEIAKQLQNLNNASVKVGFFDSKSSPYPDGKSVATVAAQNEFGMVGADASSLKYKAEKVGLGNLIPNTWNITARPFFSTAMNNNREKYGKLIENFLSGKIGYSLDQSEKFLGALGVTMQNDIQASITNGNWAPNSPIIAKIKSLDKKSDGSVKPLIWDGHMRQSVTYIVDTGT